MAAKPFSSIANIAQLREEEAAAALSDSITRKQQAEKQLAQLQNYLQDYKNSQANSMDGTQTLFKIKNQHVFIQRINFLIDKQKEEITQIQSAINQAIEDWKSNKIYNKVLNRLIDKYRDDENMTLEQYEQKVSDDYSSNYIDKKIIQ